MKKKLKELLALTLLSVILGVLLSFQMRQKIENYSLFSLNSIEIMKNDIENSRDEIENLNRLIDEKKIELEKFKQVIEDEDKNIEDYIKEEMENFKVIGGLEDIEGPGIRIVIADNEEKEIIGQNIQDDIIHDSEIQIILNDLKNAGAEAISINGQRVVSKSEVKCGGPIIRINGKSSANPFVITAIGDPKALYAAINAPQSFGWTLKEVYNKKVEAEIKDKVFIPKYNWKDSSFKYSEPIKEGD
ncbi:hypothetical protein DUF881 [Gottschalkia acidurici 9a]|uniref:Division initiation protein n=1 Tax=Gottschalkia acidurici (strain ATCC 7906 / DSM 604 / BCRC 14475 / CIP 104303 / KCTC 5404 / NCIMB 10678 / 9a) TaxID=1128398 RepID=K0B0Z3_GOTA9|nr:DUF881 domain-containing protein [Gottschalkia acidurici]AFS78316.1 hypothetical protein DUF881 [Gottschalkia acidurici 9a]